MRLVEIIGGGLAGLALGRALLREGVAVELHEAQDYPRHRVCGEFICGLREATIARLDLAAFFEDAPRHRSMAWHWKGGLLGRNTLPTPAIGLSRHTLDHRLARAFVEDGGKLETKSRIRPDEARAGRVWTTGRRVGSGEWLGLKTHCRGLALSADLEFHLGEGAYVGACPVEGGAVNVCGLFRRRPGLRAAASEWLVAYLRASGLPDLAARVEATALAGTQASVAAINFDRHPPERRMVVGDAFAMIPPFTGDGMAMAFEGADLAAPVLVDYARGVMDWEEAMAETRRRLRGRFGRRLRLACALHHFLVSAKGQACIAVAARGGFLPFRLLFRWLH